MAQQNPRFILKKYRSLQNLRIFNKDKNLRGSSPTGPKIERPLIINSRNQFALIKAEKREVQKSLKRVKSTEVLSMPRQTSNYKNIVEFYKKQNINLKKQNKFLLSEVRKRKKNQQSLYIYIEQLQNSIRNIEDSKKASEKQSSYGYLETSRTNFDTYYNSRTVTEQSDDPTLTNQMEELANKFNNLMEQCSNESNKKTRNVMRSRLAQTVEKMKIFRKENGYNN